MMLRLSAPSKTFLLGEYVALQGGPTLVITSQPHFALTAKYTQEKTPVIFEHIDKESPAGKFLLQYAGEFRSYHLTFHDPYNGLGGFGASTAQFLLVNALKKVLAGFNLKLSFDIKELLPEYLQYAWDGEGVMPSGADLIAQAQGGISYFYKEKNRLQKLDWPFKDMNYYLLHTGSKIPTHQHLKELSFLTTHKLIDIVFAGLQYMQTQDAQGFAECVNQYAHTLQELGLVLDKTTELLKAIKVRSEVLAAKGCGALGADVILVLVASKDHLLFSEWLKENRFNLIAYGNQVATGLQLTTEAKLSL